MGEKISRYKDQVKLYCGDCLDILPTLSSQSVDAVICDPPYPHVKRSYGYWTTEDWWSLIVEGVIPEVQRVLKPTGSAVFILQPNSEKVGKLRGWLWEFMAWVCREWNMVQDVWWWNITAVTTGVSTPRERGLLRASLKACVWCGPSNCYRAQDKVLWDESMHNAASRTSRRMIREEGGREKRSDRPSGQGYRYIQAANCAVERGGVTPFNVLPIPTYGGVSSAGFYGHGAGTPLKLADWWTRYICPPGGIVLDPFAGSGTMALAALQNDCSFIGIEKELQYVEIMQQRIDAYQLTHGFKLF